MFRRSDELAWRLVKGIMLELEEDRSREIHVTDLVYECPRRAWYEKKLGYGVTSLDTAFILWVGKKLHETGMDGCEHEVPVEFELGGVRVVGRIDELCDGGDLVVDKKSTRRRVSKPYDHHVMQVLLYAEALRQMRGRVPSRGAVVYMNVADNEVTAFEFRITRVMLEQAVREAARRARELWEAMVSGRVPGARHGWICNYCPYVRLCALHDARDKEKSAGADSSRGRG